MIPVILIVIAWWAGSGVVTHIKTARTSNPQQKATSNSAPATGAKTAAAAPGAPQPRRTLAPGDVTFRQWQRSLYDRSKARIRSRIPGQRLGKKATDLLGDVTAAALASSLMFGMGFTLGGAWAGARTAQRRTQRTRGATSAPKNGPAGNNRQRQPRNPRPGMLPGSGTGFNPRRTAQDQTPPRYATGFGAAVPVFELLDDNTAPTFGANPSQYASSEYADVVLPELTAHNPSATPTATNGTSMASEILTIHHLLRWAQGAFEHAVNVINQSRVRASSAIERASHALVRSNTAVARRDTAVAVADTAHQHAVQLEETAARFSTLRMDSASMTSIGVGITTAVGLAQAERRRAEAEAAVAERAAALAVAEQVAAEAAQASAQAAAIHAEAVQNMHDTVRRNQMPHAEALAATGNDAAHPSLLAAG
jgi:hypothetical protein